MIHDPVFNMFIKKQSVLEWIYVCLVFLNQSIESTEKELPSLFGKLAIFLY